MSFILREREERRKRERRDLKMDLLIDEARRFGALSGDPVRSEKEFIGKIRSIQNHFSDDEQALAAAQALSRSIRDAVEPENLPVSTIDPKMILELL